MQMIIITIEQLVKMEIVQEVLITVYTEKNKYEKKEKNKAVCSKNWKKTKKIQQRYIKNSYKYIAPNKAILRIRWK